MKIFTEEFLRIDNSSIVNQVRDKGFFKYENALTSEFIENIESDVKKADLSLNRNNVAGVYFTHGNQFFLTHMLAASKSFYNYCTKNLNLNIIGTMCIPPFDQNPEPFFKQLQEINKTLNLNELSMGMSADYLLAVKCGSTFLRIGSKIFGERS